MGFIAVVGSFTADGTGKITAGEADTNGVLGAQNGNIIISASSYSVGPDNRGCATLATPFGTFVTHFALGSMSSGAATGGRIIEWDSPSASAYIASGQLLLKLQRLCRWTDRQLRFPYRRVGSFFAGWARSLCGRAQCRRQHLQRPGAGLQRCLDSLHFAAPALAGTYTALDANGRGTGIITLGDNQLQHHALCGVQLATARG